MKTLILVASFIISSSVFTQCNSEVYKQFDFWKGEWEVFDTTGTKIGENTIVELEDGCLLSEHWRSTKGGSGRSYSYFDRKDSTWNQTWVDKNGGSLVLKGKAGKDKITLESALQIGPKGNEYINRITWTLLKNKSVEQKWDLYDKNGKYLSTAFIGIYKKK